MNKTRLSLLLRGRFKRHRPETPLLSKIRIFAVSYGSFAAGGQYKQAGHRVSE